MYLVNYGACAIYELFVMDSNKMDFLSITILTFLFHLDERLYSFNIPTNLLTIGLFLMVECKTMTDIHRRVRLDVRKTGFNKVKKGRNRRTFRDWEELY